MIQVVAIENQPVGIDSPLSSLLPVEQEEENEIKMKLKKGNGKGMRIQEDDSGFHLRPRAFEYANRLEQKRDYNQALVVLERRIREKKDLLFRKNAELRNKVVQNRFLENVVADYDKYNRYIVQEKERERRSMELLNQYLDKIIVEGQLTDEDLESARREQDDLLQEMDVIKGKMDTLITK